jgi:hypothetical protein
MRTFGSKASRVGKENLPEAVCTYCKSKGTLDMFFFYRYYHFFGIPIFPHRRGGAIMCSQCKHVTNAKQFPLDLRDYFMHEKRKYKAPWWQYLGGTTIMVLLVTIVSFKLLTYGALALNNFMGDIKPGNIYKYNLSKKKYTFWKINRVQNDSVYYLPGNYEYSGTPPQPFNFNQPDFFDTTERLYLKSEIKTDYKKKKIKKFK